MNSAQGRSATWAAWTYGPNARICRRSSSRVGRPMRALGTSPSLEVANGRSPSDQRARELTALGWDNRAALAKSPHGRASLLPCRHARRSVQQCEQLMRRPAVLLIDRPSGLCTAESGQYRNLAMDAWTRLGRSCNVLAAPQRSGSPQGGWRWQSMPFSSPIPARHGPG
jgi:hypothetical protein